MLGGGNQNKISERLKLAASTQLPLGVAMKKCGPRAARSDFSRDSGNLDFHVKISQFLNMGY